jgi:hypothetical protein
MRYAPVDELDDPSPPQLPLIRFCGALNCRRRARTGGRHCTVCHAAAVRRWRDERHRELAVRRRDAAALRDEDARARDSARAKLAMAIRRGKIARDRCRFCGSKDVIALMADPAKALQVQWVCRADRQAEIGRRRVDEARRTAATAQSGWECDRAEALAAVALLPPPIQVQLAAIAARGPGGLQLSPEAPLYVMQLVRAYKATFPRIVP